MKPIPDSGEDEYEILAIVEPPIVYDGGQVTTVSLRGHDDRLRDSAGKLLIGDKKILTVWVRSAEGDSELGVDFSSVATHLPELWRRGGYWEWFVDAINAFVAREGHADVPPDHVEDGFDDVGQYVDKLRWDHDKGNLSDEQNTFLEALSGWRW